MSLTFQDRDPPLSTTFSQILIWEQAQCCRLNMLKCITNVSVVFPSSPGSISVVFPMCLMCFRSLHLFVYSFKHVIQVHYVASIHLPAHCECEEWKIGFCSTCRVVKCLCSIKCKCTGWITVPFESGLLSNYLYLCGDAFSNVIQLEPEPSIRKAAELKYKIHNIWYKPVVIEEIWSQFHQ